MPERSVTARLQDIADAIRGMFLKSEQMCLSAGESLGSALDSFGSLAGIFAALPSAFDGDDMKQAIGQLDDVTRRIKSVGAAWSEEQSNLLRLLELSNKLSEPIERLRASMRTICAVTIYAKVEVRSIDTHADDLNSFIDDLTRLVNSSQSTIDEYWAEHGKLLELLRSSHEAQVAFAASHQGKLASVAQELEQSIQSIAGRRQNVADAAGEISQRSQEISRAIGAVVMALQAGDATRQRIEHVKDSLEDISDIYAGETEKAARDGAASSAWHGTIPVSSHHGNALTAGEACRLQSTQTSRALEDFEGEIDSIRASLSKLAGEAVAMVALGSNLYGGSESGDKSFMQVLKTRLDAAGALIHESQEARASVDRVMSLSMETLAGLQERVTKLSEIVVDMTLIGMNGILKSIRVGGQGKGLSVIAQELRNYANHAIEAANILKPALAEMVVSGGRFQEKLSGAETDGMAELGRSMAGALSGIQRGGTQVEEAMKALTRDGALASGILKRSMADIAVHEDLRGALRDAVDELDAIAVLVEDSSIEFPGEAIAAACWKRYTMTSERDIHNHVLGETQALAA